MLKSLDWWWWFLLSSLTLPCIFCPPSSLVAWLLLVGHLTHLLHSKPILLQMQLGFSSFSKFSSWKNPTMRPNNHQSRIRIAVCQRVKNFSFDHTSFCWDLLSFDEIQISNNWNSPFSSLLEGFVLCTSSYLSHCWYLILKIFASSEAEMKSYL